MIRLIIMAGLVFGFAALPVMGKVVSATGGSAIGGKPDKPGKISDSTQSKIDKIKAQAKSNDWNGIKQVYADINWQDGDAVMSLKALAKEVPKNKNTKELRREIKTKYALLREDAVDIPELADVDAYPVQIVYVPTITLAPLVVDVQEIPAMRFYPISVIGLLIPGLSVPFVDVASSFVPFIKINDAQYEQAMAAWSRRWRIAIDAVGSDGVRIIPHPYTALGMQRAALMQMIEAQGWTPGAEKAWAQYYQDLSTALNRRIRLKKI
ncbi:MAG: hypothetical protein PHW60_03965 [Kiritimatiellae bacterium]|nr:hypothetical protein [Kiritimatiellia bacterium]